MNGFLTLHKPFQVQCTYNLKKELLEKLNSKQSDFISGHQHNRCFDEKQLPNYIVSSFSKSFICLLSLTISHFKPQTLLIVFVKSFTDLKRSQQTEKQAKASEPMNSLSNYRKFFAKKSAFCFKSEIIRYEMDLECTANDSNSNALME